MDAATNILYGVISGIIASFFFELLRAKSSWFPGPSDSPEEYKIDLPDEERAKNRAKLNMMTFNVFFYFYTFFIVYMALFIPASFKTLFNDNPVHLSDARFIGHLLPSIEIGSGMVQPAFIIATTIIYIPLLLIVSKLSVPLAKVVDKFRPVNIYRWRGIQGILFAMFSAFFAILSIYLFNETTIKNAFFTFAIFILMAIGFAAGGKK